MSVKRWTVAQPDGDLAANLAEECEIHPFLALLLTTRGVTNLEEATDFLVNGEIGDDVFAFADMDAAVERIQRAIDSYERIAVFGDYDADGVTATALLYDFLAKREADVVYYIPQREGEGYGLHRDSVEKLKEMGAKLLVTVDNGIAALEEAAYAAELGMDVVITDHHQPQEALPQAVAVVDPHRSDCGSACKDYAGVGVAFKLICALDGDADQMMEEYGDLVALGTLADVMQLRGENRTLVRRGLQVMNERRRPGLAKLMEVAGVGDKRVTASTAVFTLAPRINAAGRMGSPETAARLLLTADGEEAAALAEDIQQLNVERQAAEAAILGEVLERLKQQPERLAARILVLEGDNWHPGVVGIIASRLMERFGKPCIVLSVQDGVAKGSGRSLPGFSLFDALTACKEVLTAYGGHSLAAGVTLEAARIDEFREAVNAYATAVCPRMPVPELHVDFRMRPSQIDVEKLDLLAALEPCGTGNPAPVFGLFQMRLDNIVPVGGGKHLRLSLSREGTAVAAMKFHTTPADFPVPCGETLNLAVTLERNEYRGTVSPSIIIKDVRFADTRQEELLEALDNYGRVCRREKLGEGVEALPTREGMSRVYRLLRAAGRWSGTLEQLHRAAGAQTLNYLQLRLALDVFRQAGLIDLEDLGDRLHIAVRPAEGKADLNATPLMQYLQSGT